MIFIFLTPTVADVALIDLLVRNSFGLTNSLQLALIGFPLVICILSIIIQLVRLLRAGARVARWQGLLTGMLSW